MVVCFFKATRRKTEMIWGEKGNWEEGGGEGEEDSLLLLVCDLRKGSAVF